MVAWGRTNRELAAGTGGWWLQLIPEKPKTYFQDTFSGLVGPITWEVKAAK